jgi:hypothetical protein
MRPYLKNKLKQKQLGGMAQVVEALSSNPSTTKKEKKEFRILH